MANNRIYAYGTVARGVEFRGLHGNGFSVGYVGEFAGWLSRQLRLKAAGSRRVSSVPI